MARMSVYLPDALYERLAAVRDEVSCSALFTRAIENYLQGRAADASDIEGPRTELSERLRRFAVRLDALGERVEHVAARVAANGAQR